MEAKDNRVNGNAKPKKKGTFWRVLLTILLLAILAVGCLILYRAYSTKTEATSVTTYRTSTITEGEVNTTLSGSSTLAVTDSLTATAPAAVTVKKINYAPGDVVPAGSPVMILTSDDIDSQLTSLYTELQTAQNTLAGTTKTRNKYTITAPKKGIVKDIQVSAGDACDNLDYLCVISTDGLMKVTVPRESGMRLYETVYVTVAGATVEGMINRLKDTTVEITFDDNNYSIGTPATVRSAAGADYGSGTIDANEAVLVIQTFGCIQEVLVTENQSVKKNAVLFKLTEDTPSDNYHTRLEAVRDIETEIADLKDSLKVTADWEAMLATVSVTEGQEVSSGTTLCYLVKNDGYTLDLNVDESDISSVAIGQDVTITLDALDGTYNGKVTNLSYSGSGSYITSFTATIKTDMIEGAYPGMSATANIITSTSGKALVVPVDAVQYKGSETYLLLAGDSGSSSSRSKRSSSSDSSGTAATTATTDATAATATAAAATATGTATDSASATDGASDTSASAPSGFPGTGDGSAPADFDPSNMPEGFDASNMPEMPEGFDPSNMPSPPSGFPGSTSGTSDTSSSAQTSTETGFFQKIGNWFKNIWNKLKALITGTDDTANVSTFNADNYEHLPVTTGMSDGSYIVVSGDNVTAGTRIIVPVLKTTATYTASTTTTTSGFSMGGMSMGGGMPGGFSGGGMPSGGPSGFGGSSSGSSRSGSSSRSSSRN